MSEKKNNPNNSADDKASSGMTSEFGDVFDNIKENIDADSEKQEDEQESSIRGIFSRIKKKNSNQNAENSDAPKKSTSMQLSESQEILDLSQKVTESSKQDSVVVVAAEENSKGITTITMKIPKLTDEKLAELKSSEDKKQTEVKQDLNTENKSQPRESKTHKQETVNSKVSDDIENIGDVFKKSDDKTDKSESEELDKSGSEKEIAEQAPKSFKSKLSKFFATAKEKAIYYLGFNEDDDYDDDVIYSTSSGVERSKNANPLDFDEEYKDNIVYQASDEEKKDDKPDLLKVAAQNTTINQEFDFSEEKTKQSVEEKVKSEEVEKAVEAEKIEQSVEAKAQSEKIEQSVKEKINSEEAEKTIEAEKIEQSVEEKAQPEKIEQQIDAKSESANKQDNGEINTEDLTFDEILAAEKRKQISIDISLDDDVSGVKDTSDSPLYDQLDFSVLAKQIAGDVLRKPQKSKNKLETKAKSEVSEQPIEAETKSEVSEQPIEAETKSEVSEQPIEAETKSEVSEQPIEAETKLEVSEQPIETKTKSEVSEQPIEPEVKSEVSEQPIEPEAKSEVSEQPVETETKSEVSEQPIEPETKSEVSEQPIEPEAKSEVSEQPIEAETRSEVSEQSVEENKTENSDEDFDLSSPFIQIIDRPRRKSVRDNQKIGEEPTKVEAKAEASEESTKVEAKAEASEESTEVEAKAEASEEPTEVEVKAEASEKSTEVEAKAEASEEPTKVEAKAEASEEPTEVKVKAEASEESTKVEAKAEAIEKSTEVEVKAEASEESTEIEAKAEASEEPTEVEAKAEASEEPTKVETKAEESVQKTQDENDINPFIRIVDKVKKNPPPVKVETEKFNPVIVQTEKPVQEFKLDFEKGYREAPKNLLIYKRPSERSSFVVMAGKFTKTVRSEYRAYRYKPTPKPPENPSPTTNDDKKQQVKANHENPLIKDFSSKKSKKKDEQPQDKEASKTHQKAVVQKSEKVKNEPVEKQESQKPKTEEAAVKTPKVKIPKPKLPPITATVKSAVPGFMKKKQRPEIMPDINKEKADEEAKEKVQEKVNQKPKAEKESKPNKVSEARKAIRKKTQTLKLFSSDEDIETEDIDGIADKKEIEEYEDKSEEKEIRFEINNNYRKLTIRSIVVSICFALSLIIDVFVGFMSEIFINMPFGWLLIAFLNALVLCVSVVFCYVPIINGIMPLKNFKGNSDTGIAVASFAGILQSFVSFFTPEMFINGSLHYYTTLIIMALLINCIGRMMIIKRVHDNFRFIMKNPELYAGKIYTDERNAKKMFSGAPLNKPLIAYRKKTKFLSNFLQLSYAPDPSENMAAKIAPIASVIALAGAVVYGIIAGGVSEGASAFALFAIMLTPICELIAVNLPIKNLCSAVVRKGSMVTSYESVKQFCDTNAIIVDSNDLYPSGTVTMSGIKTFSGSKVDDAIRGAAAIMLAVKAPMSSMFDNIIKSKRDTLPHVESVIYEDGLGLVGWVAGQRILLGNRRLLDAHGIKVPSVEYEKKYTDKSKQAVYLSLGGELVSMFIVTYKGSISIAEELRSLEQNGVTLLVRTIDSNITQDRIAEDFGVFYRSVKILPTGLGNITKEMTDTPDEETRAYIATKGGIQSFARAISGCIRIKSNVTLSIVIQMAAIILGFVLVGTITLVSGISRLNILELLIYFAFWIAAVIIAPAIRKP